MLKDSINVKYFSDFKPKWEISLSVDSLFVVKDSY